LSGLASLDLGFVTNRPDDNYRVYRNLLITLYHYYLSALVKRFKPVESVILLPLEHFPPDSNRTR